MRQHSQVLEVRISAYYVEDTILLITMLYYLEKHIYIGKKSYRKYTKIVIVVSD